MKFLGIDFGLKRIGLALSDSQGKVVLPFTTLKNSKGVENRIKKLVEERKIEAIVIGLPKDLKNNSTSMTQEVEKFAKKLKKILNIPIYFQDEKLTSFEAEERLKHAGIPLKKGKKIIDQLAAVEILEDFLNNHV